MNILPWIEAPVRLSFGRSIMASVDRRIARREVKLVFEVGRVSMKSMAWLRRSAVWIAAASLFAMSSTMMFKLIAFISHLW